jgi:endo-1,4-beta-D-glucanase Y
LWLEIHDYRMNNTPRYLDGVNANPGYLYGKLPGWTGVGADSATDGDEDIGLALLIAWHQWGDLMGINYGGTMSTTPISYKQAALDFINAMVAQNAHFPRMATRKAATPGMR